VRARLAAALCGTWLGVAGSAGAAEISWNAPDTCELGEGVSQQVERLLGQSLQSVDNVDFEVTIESRAEDAWRLRLVTVERAGGERRARELGGRSCREVADAAAVAITMAIRGSGPEEEVEAPPSAERPAEKAKPVAVEKPRPAPNKSASRAHVAIGASGMIDIGALPHPAPGGELSLALDWRHLRIVALGAYLAPVRAGPTNGRGGLFELWFWGALACATQAPARVSAEACGGFELGRLSGEGRHVTDRHLGSSTWEALRAEVGLRLGLTEDLGLMGRLGVAFPLIRKQFQINEPKINDPTGQNVPVHQPSSLTGRAMLGLEMRL
jgi:hypothetical protein